MKLVLEGRSERLCQRLSGFTVFSTLESRVCLWFIIRLVEVLSLVLLKLL